MHRLLIVLLFFFVGLTSGEESVSPQKYFGDSYDDALQFCSRNKDVFKTYFSSFDIEPALAFAIVFPEIVRYNRFRDFMETTALELAYVSGGKSMANFSIGRFQMKPSFVEMIEDELLYNEELSDRFSQILYHTPDATVQQIRQERITRLKSQQWQLQYLACFIKLAQQKFSKELQSNSNEVLLILSSAYNLGLNADYESLKLTAATKSFPYGNPHTGRFSYFDVANYFFLNHSPKLYHSHEN